MGLRLGYLMACRLVGGLALWPVQLRRRTPRSSFCAIKSRCCIARWDGPGLTWPDRAIIAALALRLPPAGRLGMLITPG
jgi:hypothetical protein